MMLKKLTTLLAVTFISLTLFHSAPAVAATVHTVQKGDSLWKISMNYGVSVHSIKQLNNRSSDMIYPGDRLNIPTGISASDRDLLAKLVRAEAEGEPYAGKVAVATVVLNRLDHPEFPNSVRDVIYERTSSGHYAFSPVANGTINNPADAESIRAVNEALAFRGQGNGSIYFYNPNTATSNWIKTRTTTVKIGNHVFAK